MDLKLADISSNKSYQFKNDNRDSLSDIRMEMNNKLFLLGSLRLLNDNLGWEYPSRENHLMSLNIDDDKDVDVYIEYYYIINKERNTSTVRFNLGIYTSYEIGLEIENLLNFDLLYYINRIDINTCDIELAKKLWDFIYLINKALDDDINEMLYIKVNNNDNNTTKLEKEKTRKQKYKEVKDYILSILKLGPEVFPDMLCNIKVNYEKF